MLNRSSVFPGVLILEWPAAYFGFVRKPLTLEPTKEELRMSAGVLGAIFAVLAGVLFVAVFRSKGKRKR
jgi:DNA-binding transcriptional regulator GbsR (MarR family)